MLSLASLSATPLIETQDDIDGGFSDKDIVPEDFQNRLMSLRDMMTACSWGIGDIANDLIRQNAEIGMQVTAKRIYKAVGRFCGRTGRTVRYYAETASFFPQEVREEYDVLSFAHFVFARQMKEIWREVLEYAASVPGVTLENLQAKYLPCQNPDTETGESPEVSQFISAALEDITAGPVENIDTSEYTAYRDSRCYNLMSAASTLVAALSEYQEAARACLGKEDSYAGILKESDAKARELREIAGRVASIASAL